MYKTIYIIENNQESLNRVIKASEELGYGVSDTLIRGGDIVVVMQKDYISGLN